ncbi:hypothetical protein [Mycolicibacterium conceptionense]|uniref:hypothetical protein n=1 Tax=Mycolicibacterium conceptionense TaxID=451644 RepID=UPI001054E101|nr:hypothetical protein [Mycolicibacterium conceptionense]
MRLVSSSGATAADRQDAYAAYQVVANELPAVRAMADSWRKGLAGLLAAVIGFSLIQGRSNLNQLSPGWAILVGVLLAAVLVVGAAAAWLILGAAHGTPRPIPVISGQRSDGTTAVAATTHDLAMSALRRLRIGLLLTGLAVVLLVAAIGSTWYGPARSGSKIAVTDGGGTLWCGTSKQARNGSLTLDTAAGTVVVDLTKVQTLTPVESCPKS